MGLSIGETSERSGLSADTLRYYERIDLLPSPARSPGGHRIYYEQDLERLRFIIRAQAVGFTLDEIGQLLRFREDPAGTCREVRELAAHKHSWVCERMDILEKMESELALLLSICSGDGKGCPIIDRLDQND